MARLRRSGLGAEDWLAPRPEPQLVGGSAATRMTELLAQLEARRPKRISDMMCIIAYDIESNKVRTQVAKFLIGKGCLRIQKSVYFGLLSRKQYREMVEALRTINALYENDDSIFFLPVADDQLSRIEIIGRDLYLQVARDEPNTLFF
ncbi:MAG: CRISPR-associated endonuclease Cas2 [Bacteroidetes bacterium]|nr:MAG: CRISPR-associated endonuclease Cas2 [Bacteroidota bacterium]